MEALGHTVELWMPAPKFYKMPFPNAFKKWLGYIDQYLVFPGQVKKRMRGCDKKTLFVFADNALGPWVPLVVNRPHIIHCHDFLAQQSALGLIEENPTSWSGKKYQAYIRQGFTQGKNFISVSQNTKTQLHKFLKTTPGISEVVHNALTQKFEPLDKTASVGWLQKQTGLNLSGGYILHVGGNQWYKNRVGVIEIYNEWRENSAQHLPLLLVGALPNESLTVTHENSLYKSDIHFISGKSDAFIKKVYAGASVMIFPSLAEGFGWPIAEAMASGCVVITTGDAPMTEVAGGVAFLIDKRPRQGDLKGWAQKAAVVVEQVLQMDAQKRNEVVNAGRKNIERFDSEQTILKIEAIYKEVLNKQTT